MIFEYTRGLMPNGKIPTLEVEEISRIIDTSEDGTVSDNIDNLNSNREVLKAKPSIELEVSFTNSFSEIEKEIEADRPVIAWIFVSDNHRGFAHSVVVTGLDMENGIVHYNDPIYGEVQGEIGTFVSMWEKTDTVLIKIKIGEREQRKIEEYTESKTKEGIEDQ